MTVTIMSASRAFFLLILVLSSAVVATGPLQDPDLWWHIKTGEIIVNSGFKLPEKDIYSYTASEDRPWRAYSWIPEIIFFAVSGSRFTTSERFQMFSLICLRIFILCSIGVLLFFSVEKLFQNPQVSSLLVFISWCSVYPLWELRPHIFSMFFLASVVAILIYCYLEEGEKFFIPPLVALPLIFLLWANSHIYFIWGLVIFAGFLFFYFIEKKSVSCGNLRRYAVIFVISVAATFVNPYGAGVWSQFWELARHKWTWDWVMEMARPYPWDTRVAAFWVYVVLSCVALLRLPRRGFRPFYIFLLVFSFAFSMTALRHIFMYPIVSSLAIAAIFADGRRRLKDSGKDVNLEPTVLSSKFVAVVAVGFLAGILFYRLYRDFEKPVADSVPRNAVEFINNNAGMVSVPMANYFDFGGYLIYKLWPRYKVFIDGRTQVYTAEFLDDYTLFQSRGPYDINEIKKMFERYNIKSVLWASDHPLAGILEKIFPKVLYKDKTAVILTR